MSRFGGFLARKTGLAERPANATPASAGDNPLELDEELFTALGAQVGSDNESLRNLLLDANNKINELDTIKDAVGRLVDPVSKALRAFENEKAEKLSLQSVLNNTRTAYGKLRNEVGDLEKKLGATEAECKALRIDYTNTQNLLRTVEATRAEISIDIAARRAQIAELESRLAQETGECLALREENRRLDDRVVSAERRIIMLESDLNSARQRLLMSEDEKRAQQVSLDTVGAEAARLARKLAETEASFNAAQSRLRHVEANFAEVNTERARLATALDETNERHEHDRTNQSMRLDALQARANTIETLLNEAREHLLARAEEIREFDRRNSEIAVERDSLQSRIGELEADRIRRESEIKEVEQARNTLTERSGSIARAFAAKEAALARAEEANAELAMRIAALESELGHERRSAEQTIEELNAAVGREKLDRAVLEGALETARKDFSRLMREVMAMQREQNAKSDSPRPRAANAA